MTRTPEKPNAALPTDYPAALLEDLRPGAKIFLVTGSNEQQFSEEVEVNSYPYRLRPNARHDLALESAWVGYTNGCTEDNSNGVMLADFGLVPYSSGHLALNHQILLKEPAPPESTLQQALVDILARYLAEKTTS